MDNWLQKEFCCIYWQYSKHCNGCSNGCHRSRTQRTSNLDVREHDQLRRWCWYINISILFTWYRADFSYSNVKILLYWNTAQGLHAQLSCSGWTHQLKVQSSVLHCSIGLGELDRGPVGDSSLSDSTTQTLAPGRVPTSLFDVSASGLVTDGVPATSGQQNSCAATAAATDIMQLLRVHERRGLSSHGLKTTLSRFELFSVCLYDLWLRYLKRFGVLGQSHMIRLNG